MGWYQQQVNWKIYLSHKIHYLHGLVSVCRRWVSTWVASSLQARWTAHLSCQASLLFLQPWLAQQRPTVVTPLPQQPTIQCIKTQCQCIKTRCLAILEWHLQSHPSDWKQSNTKLASHLTPHNLHLFLRDHLLHCLHVNTQQHRTDPSYKNSLIRYKSCVVYSFLSPKLEAASETAARPNFQTNCNQWIFAWWRRDRDHLSWKVKIIFQKLKIWQYQTGHAIQPAVESISEALS